VLVKDENVFDVIEEESAFGGEGVRSLTSATPRVSDENGDIAEEEN
jgi:hypothetical protein